MRKNIPIPIRKVVIDTPGNISWSKGEDGEGGGVVWIGAGVGADVGVGAGAGVGVGVGWIGAGAGVVLVDAGVLGEGVNNGV